MAQAGDTLLSRNSQGMLRVDISAASLASADARPAADVGPTSPQGTSQMVGRCLVSRLSIICLHVKESSDKSSATLPDIPQVQPLLQHCWGRHKSARALFLPGCAELCLADGQGLYQNLSCKRTDMQYCELQQLSIGV